MRIPFVVEIDERRVDENRIAFGRAAVGIANERSLDLRNRAGVADRISRRKHEAADIELHLPPRQVHGHVPALRRPGSRSTEGGARSVPTAFPTLDDADHRLPANGVALLRMRELGSAECERRDDERLG